MKVTQVITTYNRGHLLRNNFTRLCDLTKPEEILVIDDGGNDNTEQVVQEFQDRLPVRYIYNNNPGPSICSHARNIGVKEASHDFIVTCEPELIYITDAIDQLKKDYEQYPDKVISAGKIYFAPKGHNNLEDVNRLRNSNDYTPPRKAQEAIGWVAPYTALWNKEWLVEVNGWDEEFPGDWGWDDIDLLTRLRINGHNQHIDLEIKAIHQFHGLGGDKNFINEAHFKSKSFVGKGDETKFGKEELKDIVANKNHEWGKIK